MNGPKCMENYTKESVTTISKKIFGNNLKTNTKCIILKVN